MIIDQLYELSSPEDNDELPLERETLTFKIKWKNLGGDAIAVLQGDMEQAQEDIEQAQEDIGDIQNTLGQLTNMVLQATVQPISANGTVSNLSLTGLTSDHVIGNWGMFTDVDCTIPIPSNAPTCDIEITTGTDEWSVTIANFSSAFYLRPTFILKQN